MGVYLIVPLGQLAGSEMCRASRAELVWRKLVEGVVMQMTGLINHNVFSIRGHRERQAQPPGGS